MTPALKYFERFEASGKSPDDFAAWACHHIPKLCLQVMEDIGSFPSSEPELAALQRAYP